MADNDCDHMIYFHAIYLYPCLILIGLDNPVVLSSCGILDAADVLPNVHVDRAKEAREAR